MDFESNFKFNLGSIEHNQNHLAYVIGAKLLSQIIFLLGKWNPCQPEPEPKVWNPQTGARKETTDRRSGESWILLPETSKDGNAPTKSSSGIQRFYYSLLLPIIKQQK
jgi:hypothetical protein